MPSVDLPLPVRPMRPIFSFGLMSNDTPWMTGGSSGEYYADKERRASILHVHDIATREHTATTSSSTEMRLWPDEEGQ